MNQVRKESPTEMKFGDLLEEFIFLVFKYQRRTKGIDYFQSTEDLDDREHENVSPTHDANDQISLLPSPRQSSKRDKINEPKYEMCTVVEEINEDEFEESPINRKVLTPSKFFSDLSKSKTDTLGFPPLEKDEKLNETHEKKTEHYRPPPLIIIEDMVMDDKKVPHKKEASKQPEDHSIIKADKSTTHELSKCGKLPAKIDPKEEIMLIKDLKGTCPEKPVVSHIPHRKDSKVTIIEKLESKIVKLLKDTKKQLEKSKEKARTGSQFCPKICQQASKRTSSHPRAKQDKANSRISIEMETTPEKLTMTYRMPKTSDPQRRSNSLRANEANKSSAKKRGGQKPDVVSSSMMAASLRKTRKVVEENKKISVSFNLEFAEHTTRLIEKSKGRKPSINISTARDLIEKPFGTNAGLLSIPVKKNHQKTPSHRDHSDTQEKVRRHPSKHSTDSPRLSKLTAGHTEGNNTKLKLLLEKIKQSHLPNDLQVSVKDRRIGPRGSEGAVKTFHNCSTGKIFQSNSKPKNNPKRATQKPDMFSKRREGSFADSAREGKSSGLQSIKDKLVDSLLNW